MFSFRLFEVLVGGMSLSGSDEAPSGNEILSKKKRSRAKYKDHLSELEDITVLLNESGNQEICFIYQN